MARPLSQEKRESILAAATELIAAHGVGASTATIAKVAGVAEGTLFTYFPTKDDLLNQLYLELSQDLVNTLSAECPSSGSAQDRIAHLMERLINWGVENRLQHKAKYQLRGSDRISAKTHRRSEALFQQLRKMVEASLKGRINPELASFYIDLLFPGIAEMTVEAILANPEDRERLTQACFDLFWKGTKS